MNIHIFTKIFKTYNPRNEREFDDVIYDVIDNANKKYKEPLFQRIDIDKTVVNWKTYALWAFGNDATECCICEDIPEHYIQCHTCDKIICNDCFNNYKLCGDAFHMIITTDTKGELGAYYCKDCNNLFFSNLS